MLDKNRRLTYTYGLKSYTGNSEKDLIVRDHIYFVDLSTEYFQRCAFLNDQNDRFLEYGSYGQVAFVLPENLDDIRLDYLGKIDVGGQDLIQLIKGLIPEGFWDR